MILVFWTLWTAHLFYSIEPGFIGTGLKEDLNVS